MQYSWTVLSYTACRSQHGSSQSCGKCTARGLTLLPSISYHSHCVHSPVLFSELFFSVLFAASSYFVYYLIVVSSFFSLCSSACMFVFFCWHSCSTITVTIKSVCLSQTFFRAYFQLLLETPTFSCQHFRPYSIFPSLSEISLFLCFRSLVAQSFTLVLCVCHYDTYI